VAMLLMPQLQVLPVSDFWLVRWWQVTLPTIAWMVLILMSVWAAGTSSPGSPVPVVCASTRAEISADELREVLADSSCYGEWCPGHLESRSLALPPAKDEVLHWCFRLGGAVGLTVRLQACRRWIRGADGVWLLCAVADGKESSVSGFEGFAVVPIDDTGNGGGCYIVWLCALDFLPWAPFWVRRRLALQRVVALAGLREWLAFPVHRARHEFGPAVPKETLILAQRASAGAQFRGFSCAVEGGLHASKDMERAAAAASLLGTSLAQMQRGAKRIESTISPHGLLGGQATLNVASRYAARWAFAPVFLPPAVLTERPRERLLQVMTFMVAGLHRAAPQYPHLPWIVKPSEATRHMHILPDDVRAYVALAAADAPVSSGTSGAPARAASFEVLSRADSGYRISGYDEVTCSVDLASSSFYFVDRGVTTVELPEGGDMVNYTMPDLRVRPSGWRLGRGSVFEWIGIAHFVDLAGGLQCELKFGPNAGPGGDAVSGALRDAAGVEMGRIKGSWLGPLLCDGEVLWRGPRQNSAPQY